jgi:hypothetical protein
VYRGVGPVAEGFFPGGSAAAKRHAAAAPEVDQTPFGIHQLELTFDAKTAVRDNRYSAGQLILRVWKERRMWCDGAPRWKGSLDRTPENVNDYIASIAS